MHCPRKPISRSMTWLVGSWRKSVGEWFRNRRLNGRTLYRASSIAGRPAKCSVPAIELLERQNNWNIDQTAGSGNSSTDRRESASVEARWPVHRPTAHGPLAAAGLTVTAGVERCLEHLACRIVAVSVKVRPHPDQSAIVRFSSTSALVEARLLRSGIKK
jgi:hypothetical protein